MTFILLALLLLVGCQTNHSEMNEIYSQYGNGTEDAGEILTKVAGLKIYFGHRSVGNNILSGIEQWENETGVQLRIIESTDFSSIDDASLVHFRIGENSNALSKIDNFVAFVDKIPQEGDPVAFFKLCYVDITPETDVDEVYNYYKEKMLYVKEAYPNIRFMACTVPYMGLQKGIKATVKKILGRHPTGRLGNIKREEFNKRLMNDFQDVMPIFDLGGIETTMPDGSKVTYNFKGTDYPYMPDIYTYDLGHLTELGSKTLAYNLLAFLAEEFN